MKPLDNLKLLLDEKSIKAKVKQLSRRINKDYSEKKTVVIGVLKGSFIFLADLVRNLSIDIEIDFLRLSSYDNNKISEGSIQLLSDFKFPVEKRDIIVVEDIVDSGLSVKFINDLISKRSPNSLEFVTLLLKKNLQKIDLNIKYVGFRIPDKFVVGYGLDYAQKYRNLKSIYFLKD